MCNKKLIDDIMRCYFKVGKDFNIYKDTKDASEFLRYTLCLVLRLKTTSEYIGYDREVDIMCAEFDKVLKENKFPRITTKKYRQGILEACIHGIEMSRKNMEKETK